MTSIWIWLILPIESSPAVFPQKALKHFTETAEVTSWGFCKRITVTWSRSITFAQSQLTNTLPKAFNVASVNSHFLITTSLASRRCSNFVSMPHSFCNESNNITNSSAKKRLILNGTNKMTQSTSRKTLTVIRNPWLLSTAKRARAELAWWFVPC